MVKVPLNDKELPDGCELGRENRRAIEGMKKVGWGVYSSVMALVVAVLILAWNSSVQVKGDVTKDLIQFKSEVDKGCEKRTSFLNSLQEDHSDLKTQVAADISSINTNIDNMQRSLQSIDDELKQMRRYE